MNLFEQIRNQIVKNEIFGNEPMFKVKGQYPEKVILWLTNNKVFKIDFVKRDLTEKGFVYEIHYKNLFTGSDFLENAYETEKYRREKALRKGYLEYKADTNIKNETILALYKKQFYSSESPTTKFNEIADIKRSELECPNWSSERDETGYAPCPNNINGGYEQLAPEDNSCLEITLNMLGYKDYNDFCERHPELSIEQCREELQNELKYFNDTFIADSWAIGENDNEDELDDYIEEKEYELCEV